MKSSFCLTWSVLVGLFLLTPNAEAARATTLILGKSKPEPKIDTPPTAEEEVTISVTSDSQLTNETASAGNVTKLTGVPQIDYIYDPNLPRELNGYNLTDYPFYNSIPEDIDFKCDGLHDGFYASIPHKCQVYHHCLFGTRYDFLCANYTAFDQKTFICHFASEVDCKNSPKYFKRNEALYKAQSTTTVPPSVPAVLTSNARRPAESQGGRRRRPGNRRRKPVYDYYDDYEESAEQDYYDNGPRSNKRKRPRPHNRENFESDERQEEEQQSPPSGPNKSLYDRPRIAPKIRRPVPINERDKYDYGSDSRAILSKEPVVEKTRYENRESENRKNNHRPSEYYGSAAEGNTKFKEPEDDRVVEREKEHARDDFDSERERERDRDRERNRDKTYSRDEYESDRERERNRDKDRDDYESERERERPRDRDRDVDRFYRDRRPPKKRRRPDEDDDYEYDEVRRYRNRNRPRYDEYDYDYDYDDRPYRPRNRDSDYRIRDHDYDRDKGYRTRDSDYDRPRNRDRNRDDKPVRNRDIESRPGNRDERPSRGKEDERPLRNKEDHRSGNWDERPGRIKDDDRPYRSRDSDDSYYRDDDQPSRNKGKQQQRSESKSEKNSRTRDRDSDRYYSEAESKKTVIREDLDDDTGTVRSPNDEQSTRKNPSNDNKNRPAVRQEMDKSTRTQEVSRNKENGYGEWTRTTERPYRTRDTTERTARPRSTTEYISEEKIKTEEPDSPVQRFSNVRTTERLQQRGRTGSIQKLKIPSAENESSEATADAEEKQLRLTPARPEIKPQPANGSITANRKPVGTKRVYFPKPVSAAEDGASDSTEKELSLVSDQPVLPQQQPPELSKESTQKLRQEVFRSKDPIKPEAESVPYEELNPTTKKPDIVHEGPKFKVPFEEQDSEELAPQAPKSPLSRRRPFLPSRGGNPNLPRGLLPVGNKALSVPRGFQKNDKNEEGSRAETRPNGGETELRPRQQQIPAPIEFRAKLTTAIGVQQPKLSAELYEQSSVDLTEPVQDSGVNYYRQKQIGQDYRNDYYEDFRPIIINTQSLKGRNGQDSYGPNTPESPKSSSIRLSYQNPEEASSIIHVSSEIKDKVQLRPQSIKAIHSKPAALSGINQQLGPQTFYSDNPKFKTTVTLPERFMQKPTASTMNFHTATHLPIYQPGIQSSFSANSRPDNTPKDYVLAKGNENHKPLIIKFPPPEKENLDDTDEYDVSLNDALQPISTLHPRNAPTGIFLTQTQRVPQTNGFKRRNHQIPHSYTEQGELTERHQTLKRVRIETRSAPQQKKTLVHRPDSSNIQQKYALPPVAYQGMKHSNYYALLSR